MKKGKAITLKKEEKQLKVFDHAITFVKVIAFILAGTFTWLELNDVPKDLFTDNFANIFFKVTIALYYLSWVSGPIKDMKDEQSVLLIAPNKGKFTITSIGTILILAFHTKPN